MLWPFSWCCPMSRLPARSFEMREPARTDSEIAALRSEVEADNRSASFVRLARALNERGEHEEAAEVAHQGLLAQPDSIDGRLALAVAESKLGRVREALEQIKRALLIDQDNAEALALMGQILLDRGLAQRAVQFLAHAVKLAPREASYRGLLEQARDAAAGRARPPPRVSGQDVPDRGSPWAGEDGFAGDSEHTVFAPDAGVASGKGTPPPPDSLEARLAALPSVREDVDDAEPTRLATAAATARPEPPEEPTRFAPARPEPPEEPTRFAARQAKLGGSAAELSRVLGREEAESVRAAAEERLRRPPAEKPPSLVRVTPADLDRPVGASVSRREPGARPPKTPEEPAATPPPSGPESRDARPSPPPAEAEPARAPPPGPGPEGSPAAAGGPDAQAKPEAPPDEPKAATAPAEGAKAVPAAKLAPAKAAPEAKAVAATAAPAKVEPKPPASAGRGIGPVATRMVDEALFAILGQRKETPADGPAGPQKARVVRTSAELGVMARWSGLVVLVAAAFGVGYAAALAPGRAAPEVVGEELKGVAADLERGGLSALLAAEERIEELSRGNPELEPALAGALAEVHARRYAGFGLAPEARSEATAALSAARVRPLTVEGLAAAVLLSTAAASLEALDERLGAYPDSPKAWVARAAVAERLERPDASLERLVRARALNPQRRETLLETARAMARRGAHGAALATYAALQRLHDLDVEVAIERFVLGWASGADPSPDEAVAGLAGLVRTEIPEVAKDEAGRAALAFSLPRLREGRVQEALTELSKAEGAFGDSPTYQSTVGRLLLALGEADRAALAFIRAAGLEDRRRHREDLARARYAQAAGARLELEALRRQVVDLQQNLPLGELRLPYGRAKAVASRFELVAVELDPGYFPERLLSAAEGETRALEAAVLAALAERALADGRLDEARTKLDEASAVAPLTHLPEIEGRLLAATGRDRAAVERLSAAPELAPPGQLLLARLLAPTDPLASLAAYEQFFAGGGLSAEARIEQAALLAGRRDDDGALRAVDSAAQLEPGHPAVPVLRAEVLLKQGRAEEAAAGLRLAVSEDRGLARGRAPPGVGSLSAALRTELAAIALDRGDLRTAEALSKEALQTEGAPPKAHFLLGKALFARRATRREAQRELERYLSLAPTGPHAKEAEDLRRRR